MQRLQKQQSTPFPRVKHCPRDVGKGQASSKESMSLHRIGILVVTSNWGIATINRRPQRLGGKQLGLMEEVYHFTRDSIGNSQMHIAMVHLVSETFSLMAKVLTFNSMRLWVQTWASAYVHMCVELFMYTCEYYYFKNRNDTWLYR